jgi:DNA polymerase-3 subunit delta
MDSLTFLERGERTPILPLYVLHGDEHLLKREVLRALRQRVLEGGDEDAGFSAHAGDKATFAAVCDELETAPFFSARRLVVVENADPFVTRFRANLEKKVAHLPATGVLVLEVKSWPSNTRLFKLAGPEAAIDCKALAASRLPPWCVKWARSRHDTELTIHAAGMLVDLVGADMGLLAQEIEKLAIYVGERRRIEPADVDRLVGNSREEKTWKIFDAIAADRPGDALGILDRLFDQGEEPMRMLGAFSLQLRRLAQAARRALQGRPLPGALEEAGIPPFAVKNAIDQLRHLGRRRAARLYDWLLEVDLGLKGGSPLPPRTLLERFVIRLATAQT